MSIIESPYHRITVCARATQILREYLVDSFALGKKFDPRTEKMCANEEPIPLSSRTYRDGCSSLRTSQKPEIDDMDECLKLHALLIATDREKCTRQTGSEL